MAADRQDHVVRFYRAKRGQPGSATGWKIFGFLPKPWQRNDLKNLIRLQRPYRAGTTQKELQMTVATRILFVDDEPAYCRNFQQTDRC